MSDAEHARLQLLVQADQDGELGVAEAAELQAHLADCPECRALRAELADMSARLRAEVPYHAAPAALRAALQAQVPGAQVIPLRPRSWRALGVAAAVGLAVAASVVLWLPPGSGDTDEAVSSHIRALQPGHLTDVLSTDQHTVKPWFDGRIDYAPPVRDFSAAGFPLVGGRLDYLNGRPVAALVYHHEKHIIDLFVWPEAGSAKPAEALANGYNVVTWAGGGMRFQAVSDLNSSELAQFGALWREPAP